MNNTQNAISPISSYWRKWDKRMKLAGWLLVSAAWLEIATSFLPASAQIVPDATLGAESSTILPNVNINNLPADKIAGGALRGANLFHSFSDFNVGDGQRVYFANPAGVENILTRVTGLNASQILGTLGVDGVANLFLINPNGILFGQNARLDIRGSFTASTANSLILGNGEKFSATNPEAAPLLTVNVPIGLQYGTNQSAAITNQGNLSVGQNLTLAAGNLQLSGQLYAGGDLTLQASDTLQVRDSLENPFIAASGGKMLVQGDRAVDIFALNHRDSGFYSGSDMTFRSANPVGGDAHYWSGGNFRIEKLDGSSGNLYSPNDPIIRSLGDVSFYGYQGISLHILAAGKVDINTVIITGKDTSNFISETVLLSNGTPIYIDGSARPTLDIRAGVDPAFISSSVLPSPVNNLPFYVFLNSSISPTTPTTTGSPTSRDITIGRIQINPPDGVVFLTNQYKPNPSLLSGGDIAITNAGLFGGGIDVSSNAGSGGLVTIDSRNSIILTGGINTSSYFGGDGGNITLLADKDIIISVNTNIQSFVYPGAGDAGNITFNAKNAITVINTQVFSGTSGIGKGGDINIAAKDLFLIGTTSISSDAISTGKGGDLNIETSNSVRVIGINDGNFAYGLSANTAGSGNAGNLKIKTSQFSLQNGAAVTSGTIGIGNAGNVTVTADDIDLSGSLLSVETQNIGNAGNLIIDTDRFTLRDGGAVSADTSDQTSQAGQGGNITVTATEFMNLISGKLSSSTKGIGNAGNLIIATPQLIVQEQGGLINQTFYNTSNAGNGGNITIYANNVDVIGGQLFASTSGFGNAGNLTVNTDYLTVQNLGRITTKTSGEGRGGNLTINANNSVKLIGTIGNGGISGSIFAGTYGSGNAGDIAINTGNLIVKDGAILYGASDSSGNAGNLTLKVRDSVELTGIGGIAIQTTDTGNGGNLTVETKQFFIKNGAIVSASTSGNGQAGNLAVTADYVEVSGFSPLLTGLRSGIFFDSSGSGNAGNLSINTGKLVVRDGAQVSAGTSGTGQGGILNVNAKDSVEVSGTSANGKIASSLFFDSSSSGNAGELKIDTGRLIIRDGGQVSATASGTGQAGTLTVNADSVEVSGTGYAQIPNYLEKLIGASGYGQIPSGLYFDSSGAGNAGELKVDAGRVIIQNGGRISASTSATGEGGIIAVNASDFVQINGTNGQFASGLYFDSSGAGNARGISINTGKLNVENGGLVNVSGSGTGVAGDINVTADSIFLNNQGNLLARTVSGEGGNIKLQVADQVLLRHNSNILTEALGTGNGGNITINAGNFVIAVLSENSDVAATAIQGRGGNIFVTAKGVFGFSLPERLVRTPESDISAASQLGVNGTRTVNAQTSVQPNILPSKLLPALVDGRCQVGYQRRSLSSFEITNTNNLPLGYNHETNSPEADLRMSEATGEKSDRPAETLQESPLSPGQNSSNPNQLIEAQGFIFTPEGKVKLVETAPNTTLYSPPHSPQTCAAQQANSNH